jgi:hypothetical protein
MITISTSDSLLAIIDNIENMKPDLYFYTDPIEPIQVATFQYQTGKELRAHRHISRPGQNPIRTQEIMIIFSGLVLINIYDEEDKFIESHYLHPGEFFLQFQGGCGYQVIKDTRMMEIKTGPFYGDDIDRVRISIGEKNAPTS